MQKTILASVVMVAALSPVAAFAADGTLSVTGRVAAQVCTVNTGSSNFTVTLPKVATSALARAGAKAGATSFSIRLSNCNPGSGGVRASFDAGPNVDFSTGRLNIIAGAGSAGNVQIGLATTAGNDIVIGAGAGSQGTSFVEIDNTTAELNYVAQYVATGAAAAGTTTTNVTYSLEYE